MDLWLEADAAGHGIAQRGEGRPDGGVAEDGFDVDFPAVKEAGAEEAVGGEAEAVAAGAEWGGHGADEADAADRVSAGETPDGSGAYAGFGAAIDGDKRAQFALDDFAGFGFGNECIATALLAFAAGGGSDGRIAEGHVFDEADGDKAIEGQTGEIGEFGVVDAAHGDAIDFDGGETDFFGTVEAAEDGGEIAGAGYLFKAMGIEAVDADGDSVEACGAEGLCQVGEELAVGGKGEVFDAVDLAEHFDEFDEAVADGWLAPGELEAADPVDADGGANDLGDFLEGEDFKSGKPGDALFWHAVKAAVVTAVGNADTENLDRGDVGRARGKRGEAGGGNFCDLEQQN